MVKRDAWIYGLSGAIFGVLVGWIHRHTAVGAGRRVGAARRRPRATGAGQPEHGPDVDTARAADLEASGQAPGRPTPRVRTELAEPVLRRAPIRSGDSLV